MQNLYEKLLCRFMIVLDQICRFLLLTSEVTNSPLILFTRSDSSRTSVNFGCNSFICCVSLVRFASMASFSFCKLSWSFSSASIFVLKCSRRFRTPNACYRYNNQINFETTKKLCTVTSSLFLSATASSLSSSSSSSLPSCDKGVCFIFASKRSFSIFSTSTC